MKIKKLIPLLMCAVCLTACADIPPVRESVPAEEQTVVTPPENGWTADELMSVSYLDGIQLCFPLTLRDLGSAYTVYYDHEASSGEHFYNMKRNSYYSVSMVIARLNYGYDKDSITPDDRIIEVCSEDGYLSVNGSMLCSSAEELTELLGQPDRSADNGMNDLNYVYCDRDTGMELLSVHINKKSNTVVSFALHTSE